MKSIGGLNAIGAPLSPNKIGGTIPIPCKAWSGLGMGVFSTSDNVNELSSDFSGQIDDLLANGFTDIRIDIPTGYAPALVISKSAVDIAVTAGANVIWGICKYPTLTANKWATHRQTVLDNAQWAQDNGVYEFIIGNEEEDKNHYHCVAGTMVRVDNVVTVTTPEAHGFDGSHQVTVMGVRDGINRPDVSPLDMGGIFDISVVDTTHFTYTAAGANGSNLAEVEVTDFPVADIITNMKSLATDVQAIFTNGNVTYSTAYWAIPDWISAGKGDIDFLASNIYLDAGASFGTVWKDKIDDLIEAFGVDGTYLTEFSCSFTNLDFYSEDEAVQAAGITEMLDYIKASGMKRALFHDYYDDSRPFGPQGFGALKADGTYRKLWASLLGSQLAVGQNKLIDKWRANN